MQKDITITPSDSVRYDAYQFEATLDNAQTFVTKHDQAAIFSLTLLGVIVHSEASYRIVKYYNVSSHSRVLTLKGDATL